MEVLGAYPNRNISQEQLTKLLNLPTDPARTQEQPVEAVPNRARRLSAEQTAELVARYESGETVYELGSRFGIHRTTVGVILKREQVTTRWRVLTESDIAEAIARYQAGASEATVAAHFNLAPSSIHHLLKQRGIARRPNGTNQWTQT